MIKIYRKKFWSIDAGKRKNAATTLVEVLVALTILGFAIAPIFAVFLFASRSSGTSFHKVQAEFLAHSVLESIEALSLRRPEQIRFFPGRFEVSPVRDVAYSFTRFRVRNLLEVFDHVHGANKAITPDSDLYDQFGRYKIVVELSSTSRYGVYQVKVSASWLFEGKNQSLELVGDIQAVPDKFEIMER